MTRKIRNVKFFLNGSFSWANAQGFLFQIVIVMTHLHSAEYPLWPVLSGAITDLKIYLHTHTHIYIYTHTAKRSKITLLLKTSGCKRLKLKR